MVVADYQVSARGRAGLEWKVTPGTSLCFSLVLKPKLTPEREGWLYTSVTSGLALAFGREATIEWPDEVMTGTARAAATGIEVELGPEGVEWAVANVLVPIAAGPRSELLATLVESIEARGRATNDSVLPDYLARCATLGRRVRARLIPMGPGGPEVKGEAVGSVMDGALIIKTERGSRIAVRPQNLGLLEDLED